MSPQDDPKPATENDANRELRRAAREYSKAWDDYTNEPRKARAVAELEAEARAFVAAASDGEQPDVRQACHRIMYAYNELAHGAPNDGRVFRALEQAMALLGDPIDDDEPFATDVASPAACVRGETPTTGIRLRLDDAQALIDSAEPLDTDKAEDLGVKLASMRTMAQVMLHEIQAAAAPQGAKPGLSEREKGWRDGRAALGAEMRATLALNDRPVTDEYLASLCAALAAAPGLQREAAALAKAQRRAHALADTAVAAGVQPGEPPTAAAAPEDVGLDEPPPGTDIEPIAADVECMVWGFDEPEHKAKVRDLARCIRAFAPASPPTPGDSEPALQTHDPKVGDRVVAVVRGTVGHVRDAAVQVNRDDGTAIYADVSEVGPAHEHSETRDTMVVPGDRVEGIAFVGDVLDEVSPDGKLVLVDVTETSSWMIFKGQRWVNRSDLRRIMQPIADREVDHG